MKEKKENARKETTTAVARACGPEEISSKNDLRQFLTALRTRMEAREVAPVYVCNAMQHVFNLPDVDSLFDQENREIARAIWMKLKQAGVQLANPPMLFPESEAAPQ